MFLILFVTLALAGKPKHTTPVVTEVSAAPAGYVMSSLDLELTTALSSSCATGCAISTNPTDGFTTVLSPLGETVFRSKLNSANPLRMKGERRMGCTSAPGNVIICQITLQANTLTLQSFKASALLETATWWWTKNPDLLVEQ